MVRRTLAAAAATATLAGAVALGWSRSAYAGPICARVKITFANGTSHGVGDCLATSIPTFHQEESFTIPFVGQVDVSLNRP